MISRITPKSELVQQWMKGCPGETALRLAAQAAQWGWDQRGAVTEAELQQAADQELDACCEWVQSYAECGDSLRAARRPKATSKADIALADLDALAADLSNHGMGFNTTNLRHALERLKELEGIAQ